MKMPTELGSLSSRKLRNGFFELSETQILVTEFEVLLKLLKCYIGG